MQFPNQFGYRKAREMLLLDKKISAKEALDCGFITSIVDLPQNEEFFDYNLIPSIQ